MSSNRRSSMNREQALGFRNRFRVARVAVEKNGNDCMAIIHLLEDFGLVLTGKKGTIGTYRKPVSDFVNVHRPVDALSSDYHINFDRLYDIVQKARNRAAHEGARSRYFAPRVVELGLMIEDALMSVAQTNQLKDYMVTNPVVAYTWEPLIIIRKAMLSNSFTHIPYRSGDEWFVVSDSAIARYLRLGGGYDENKLYDTLARALANGMPSSEAPIVACPNTNVDTILQKAQARDSINSLPILVVHPQHEDTLLGILTFSDLM